MKIFKNADKDKGTPILLPNAKSIWIACFALGAARAQEVAETTGQIR
jgi:hypothetical protein